MTHQLCSLRFEFSPRADWPLCGDRFRALTAWHWPGMSQNECLPAGIAVVRRLKFNTYEFGPLRQRSKPTLS